MRWQTPWTPWRSRPRRTCAPGPTSWWSQTAPAPARRRFRPCSPVGCVHNHLIRCGLRTRADLVVETRRRPLRPRLRVPRGLLGERHPPLSGARLHPRRCAGSGELSLAPEEALSPTTTARSRRASSPSCPRWASPRCRGITAAQIFEVVWASPTSSSRSASPSPPRAWAASRRDDLQRELDARHAAGDGARARSPAPGQLPTLGPHQVAPVQARSTSSTPRPSTCCSAPCREGGLRAFSRSTPPGRAPSRPRRHPARPHGLPAPPGTPCRLRRWSPRARSCERFNTGAMSYGSISQRSSTSVSPWP